MSAEQDAVLDAITAVVPPLLGGLEALAFIARHLHPPHLAELVRRFGTHDEPLRAKIAAFRAIDWPEPLHRFRDQIELAAEATLAGFAGLRAAAADANGILLAYRALRHQTRALEALYPLATVLPPISRWFLDEAHRGDAALLGALGRADPARTDLGILHSENERDMRGGFSVYVPENYDPERPCPLVMALHGGAGHGRTFLWTWLREARSRGVILVTPTARGDTWSLMSPEVDDANIDQILSFVRETWRIDPARMLLTGMSDGGTFTYVSGLARGSPFTHLAPVSASFHPMLLSFMDAGRMRGLPVYLTHGALDWMFPVQIARDAEAALAAAGAKLTYREITDLSHTYPREENGRILDWLMAVG